MNTLYIYELSVIVAADFVSDARRLSWALGHAPNATVDFAAHLSADGFEPSAAYGLAAGVRPEFVELLQITDRAHLPPVPWADYGLDEDRVMALLAHLQGPPQRFAVDAVGTVRPAGQFDDLAASLGLVRVVSAERDL